MHTILGLVGAVAFLATCIVAEHVRARLMASGLIQAHDMVAD